MMYIFKLICYQIVCAKPPRILSNDAVLEECDLMVHLSLSDENKYSKYDLEVSYNCILYQHTATEWHSCLNHLSLSLVYSKYGEV